MPCNSRFTKFGFTTRCYVLRFTIHDSRDLVSRHSDTTYDSRFTGLGFKTRRYGLRFMVRGICCHAKAAQCQQRFAQVQVQRCPGGHQNAVPTASLSPVPLGGGTLKCRPDTLFLTCMGTSKCRPDTISVTCIARGWTPKWHPVTISFAFWLGARSLKRSPWSRPCSISYQIRNTKSLAQKQERNGAFFPSNFGSLTSSLKV